MKDKFSIYSPTYQRSREEDNSLTFKKSPIKFAVYEPDSKNKESHKTNSYQPISPPASEPLRKLPPEYSHLRQTLGCKPSNFDSWLADADLKDPPKINVLRSTLSSKAEVFSRLRTDNPSREGPYSPPLSTPSMLGYTRKNSFNQTVG